jgi:DGQHR domain-containing protein
MKRAPTKTHKRSEFPAIQIPTVSDTKLYVSAMPVSLLSKVCGVSRADEDSKTGYQRLLNHGRLRQIAEYLDEGKIIPGSLIISAQSAAHLEFDKAKSLISFSASPKSFLVIDGQHRLFGAKESKSDHTFSVSIMDGLTLEEEVQYFMDVNGEQKGVSRTLQLEIVKFLAPQGSIDELRIKIFHALNERPESPLCAKMSATKSVKGKLTHIPFKAAIEPLLSLKPLQDFDFEGKVAILISFLKAVENILNLSQDSSDKLTNAAFFQAIFSEFRAIALLAHTSHQSYDEHAFSKVLAPLEGIKWDLHSGTNRKAITAFGRHINELIWR